MEKLKNYVGGEMIAPLSGNYLDNWAPALGSVANQVPDSGEKDLEKAIISAKKAFPAWAALPANERARILRKISDGIRSNLKKMAQAESEDTGKPISVSLSVDIPRSALNFEFFADAATQFSSESHPVDNVTLNYTLRSPLGVVGCISPWNLPLYLLTWKIAPALAAGNCVIAKPSEVTPQTAALLSEICIEAGLPEGVLNILHGKGSGVGALIVKHPEIKAISFTGSTAVGAEIARIAAPLFKKISLELGGKNPNIIFADADFEKAVDGTVRAAFSNQGQICLCGSRIFVERAIYAEFKKALIDKIKKLKQGDPLDPATDQGAVVSKVHFEKVMSYIDVARKDGGVILTGGKRGQVGGKCSEGWFIEPTLIEGLDQSCKINS